MAGNGGGSGSNSGDESSSSTTQPLLSKHFPPPLPPSTSAIEEIAGDNGKLRRSYSEEEPVVQYPAISFLHGHRPIRDLLFLVLFLVFVLSTFAFGIFAVAHRNPHFSQVSSFSFDISTSSCVKASSLDLFSLNSVFSSSYFARDLIWTLVITLILSFPIALGILWLLRNYAKQIVYAFLPFFILIPAFFNVYWFVACALSDDCSSAFPLAYRILVLVFVFIVIGILIWIIVANLHRVELTIRIVQVAATALAGNIWLFVALPALTLGLLVYFTPIVVFLVFSRMNGDVVPKEKGGEYYCAWRQDAWVPAYFALGILTMLWSLAAMVEAQVYVVSGSIAQWYFTPEGEKSSKRIRSSLRHAFGPSFGTLCFSGLVIFIVRIVRAIVDSAQREDGATGIVNLMIKYCANFLLSAIDFVNKFTINFAAITGEAYCSSAKMTYELLKRNLLSAVFVETVSTRIMAGIAFVISAIYAIVVCVILKVGGGLGVDAYYVAALAWLLLIIVLGFFVHVLDNVIDTVYVCYGIDRDKREVNKPEVHEVYVFLPISRSSKPATSTRTPLNV